MCGIAGIYRPGPPASGDRAAVERMTDALAHRGPDERGVAGYATDDARASLVLGHTRLSVIGVARGRQPLISEDGQVATVVNGELYNHRALRRQLEGAGHTFASDSDCEVLVHLYEDRELALLDDVLGMFAFALWDGRRGRLILGRDRLGQKPLYYHHARDGAWWFASEPTPLFDALPATERGLAAIDPDALRAMLTLRYVPAPHTMLRSVRCLEPARLATIDGDGLTTQRYWSLDPDPAPFPDRRSARLAVRRALDDAVRCRLESEVPMGAFLSGGVDSTLVVGAMAAASPRPVRTFAIGFDEAAYDERSFAALAARTFGCDHTERVVRADAADILPRLVEHTGDPFGDSSAIPCWYLAQTTREHVTVALSGDAGDELFAGYRRYLAAKLAGALDRVPGGALATRAGGGLAAALRAVAGRGTRSRIGQLARLLERLRLPPIARYAAWAAAFDAAELDALLDPAAVAPGWRADQAFAAHTDPHRWRRDPVAAATALDLTTYLPGDLLVKADRTSMAHALEVRSPLLDHRLVALAHRLPGPQRLPARRLKGFLIDTCADRLPPSIARRSKMGFGVPLGAWFRGPLAELARERLDRDSRVAALCRDGALTRLLDAHQSGRIDAGERLWSLLVVDQWLRRFA